MKNQKSKKLIISTIAIIIGISCLLIFFIFFKTLPIENPHTSKLTSSYEAINVSYAKRLIETNPNLTVVDCSGGCQECTWKNGSYLPHAQWIESAETLYNSSYDLLVYCQAGINSRYFCEKLVNHVYGKIYYLLGGYLAWKKET